MTAEHQAFVEELNAQQYSMVMLDVGGEGSHWLMCSPPPPPSTVPTLSRIIGMAEAKIISHQQSHFYMPPPPPACASFPTSTLDDDRIWFMILFVSGFPLNPHPLVFCSEVFMKRILFCGQGRWIIIKSWLGLIFNTDRDTLQREARSMLSTRSLCSLQTGHIFVYRGSPLKLSMHTTSKL